jgi:hypothetical protein
MRGIETVNFNTKNPNNSREGSVDMLKKLLERTIMEAERDLWKRTRMRRRRLKGEHINKKGAGKGMLERCSNIRDPGN